MNVLDKYFSRKNRERDACGVMKHETDNKEMKVHHIEFQQI